jgi:uncharacterized protein (DUF2235 family)
MLASVLIDQSYPYIPNPPATHIRHAVSIHERRLKFRPALFKGFVHGECDLKEMWFVGNHGDIGAGWPRNIKKGQKRLLSDIPLAWMLNEVRTLPNTHQKLDFLQVGNLG